MILLSHPTANQNVRQAAVGLAEAGLLGEFWTCLNWKQSGVLDHALGLAPRLQRELRRRSFPRELSPFIRTLPGREMLRLVGGRAGLRNKEGGFFSVDGVYHALDRRVASRLERAQSISAVYAYDDGALATFRAAKRCGLKCIYEHPIVHWRKVQELQREEAELHPEWAPTLVALTDSRPKLARKDEELALADVIVTPSNFSRESLSNAPGLSATVRVVPYGASRGRDRIPPRMPTTKLRVLFVGALTQAKGLGYLLTAVDRMTAEIDLTLIGRRVAPTVPTPDQLAKHRWIPSLPNEKVLEEMARHDVLVLPSLHEGFGLVITEAMSQGMAVITTPQAGASDLLTDGVEGFVVPIRSGKAIEERLWLLCKDRERLREMQEAAQTTAAACTWENYRSAIVQMAREVMGK